MVGFFFEHLNPSQSRQPMNPIFPCEAHHPCRMNGNGTLSSRVLAQSFQALKLTAANPAIQAAAAALTFMAFPAKSSNS